MIIIIIYFLVGIIIVILNIFIFAFSLNKMVQFKRKKNNLILNLNKLNEIRNTMNNHFEQFDCKNSSFFVLNSKLINEIIHYISNFFFLMHNKN